LRAEFGLLRGDHVLLHGQLAHLLNDQRLEHIQIIGQVGGAGVIHARYPSNHTAQGTALSDQR